MIVQTISGISSNQDFLNIMNLFENNNLMDIRINLCKFSIEKSIEICSMVRDYLNTSNGSHSIFLDLPYPYNKPRIVSYDKGSENIIKGKDYNIIFGESNNCSKTDAIILDFADFQLNAHLGSIIYYGDGEGAFEVSEIHDNYLKVIALNSFYIIKGKAILCGYKKVPFEKLEELLNIISEIKDDVFVMPSFVEDDKEMIRLSNGLGQNVWVLAKIETDLAVQNFDRILEQCDGILLARGDLAMNVDLRTLLDVENLIVKKTKLREKKVFCATDILNHLEERKLPERSELSDLLYLLDIGVSDFILPGTDTEILKNNNIGSEELISKIKNKTSFIKTLI